ncbi:hypothetical protein BBK36DRAFT_1176789 [Trichoderma citrinoviride]|uniref:Uncharacterized protein n=1 Tax=Trichoderma citrinoviride TaxID=58853 RepID=A0A2T4B5L0_9HYPO|nr:hypothetical protein BBK36DRAFT_1176789 [Trichoderma citrinoviride]PTB64604.1 hypothetical protein BBK36DRAFT_1176789 [Trichoderma citrinoviride]
MQTVPSLIGTGTAIAAAASGLVFGQPVEPALPLPKKRYSQLRKEISFDRDLPVTAPAGVLSPLRHEAEFDAPSIEVEFPQHNAVSSPIIVSRPPLSRYQRPSHQPVTSPKVIADRRSLLRQRENSASPTPEGPRDSTSSSESWIRRLSIRRRPLSRTGSVRSRSSVGPDSPSIAQSYTSSAPILSRPNTAANPLAPNKLVKRSPSSAQSGDSPAQAHVRSRSHLSILRRPATSHQRSATLHHFRPSADIANLPTSPAFSFDQSSSRQETLSVPALAVQPQSSRNISWVSFFHSRRKNTTSGGGIASRLGDGTPGGRTASGKRIAPGGQDRQQVHLVKPRMVSGASAPPITPSLVDRRQELGQARDETGVHVDDRSMTPENAARPQSMPFAPVGAWISQTSGSLRRPKRGAEPDGVKDGRHVSAASESGSQVAVELDSKAPAQSPIPPSSLARQGPALGSAAQVHQLTMHKRSHSSPLPPAPRSSKFQGEEVPRLLASPGGAPSEPTRQHQPSGSSTSSAAMSQLTRASPLHEGFDSDARGFTSGDEDDADYRSDTVFDSLRTAASSRTRAVETPLDSIYDDSPPSTAGNNGRTKRLSIQEILGHTWAGDTDIVEEDESTVMPTGVESGATRARYSSRHVLTLPRISSESSQNGVSLYGKEFGRISLDDDFDQDWAADDDAHFNPLSPPSKGSSLNSRGINPNVRMALANMSLENMSNMDQEDRHINNLFDWSETSFHEKNSSAGVPLRPKTSYEKQELDARGGRSVLRNHVPAHIRSQSVPLSHVMDEAKSATGAKFGTWGMGTKTASEDWDEDFEFGGGGNDHDGAADDKLFSVPESIRASQPSVKAHSGQIRELSLLVNDLKRLCRHGRDMDMLDGPQKTLWKEAEGVIALASPDEEDSVNGENDDGTSSDSTEEYYDGFSDDEFADLSFGKLDMSFDYKEPMSKTAVIRERQSPKRRSVFSPDDDIFGGNWPLVNDGVPSHQPSRTQTPELRADKQQEAARHARSVLEAMHRSSPNHDAQPPSDSKMQFDTNSLRVLVKRAGELRDSLSDVVRRAEHIAQSPAGTPRRERPSDSSPAFMRMFDDPGSSQSRRSVRPRGNLSSLLDASSPDGSSSPSPMTRRIQTMITS